MKINHGRVALAWLLTTLLLTACGGGGGGAVPAGSIVGGIAAVGTPIVGGTINIFCAAGSAPPSTTTSSAGAWQVSLSGQTMPCAVEVSGGTINNVANQTTYNSIAIVPGTVNITPLTDLMVANLVGTGTPSTWFATLITTPSLLTGITQTKVNASLSNMSNALSGLTPLSFNNPITTPFTPVSGNVNDDMLTALATAMTKASLTYSSLLSDASAPAFTIYDTAFNAFLTTAFSGTPTVISTNPSNSSTSSGPPITITFSESMNPSTVTTAAFTLTSGSTPIFGTITYNGNTAIFTPSDPLASYTSYTATITTEVKDLAGKSMPSNYSWSFTTPYQTPYPYLDVLHTRLTFDATRGLLYAFVPGSDANHPNTFAIINVNQRTVEYSPVVDFVPFTMEVSPDGSYLYVGTATSHEVVRLSLPDFSVNLRVDLGTDAAAPTWWTVGQKFDAGHIAISPLDSELFAVPLIYNLGYSCATGLRIYKNATMLTQLYNSVDTWVGDIVKFDSTGTQLTTLCSQGYPDIVSRLTYGGSSLAIIDSQRGISGIGNELSINTKAILTGSGNKFDMPAFTLRGSLPPLTTFSLDGPPLLQGCVFADDTGLIAACLSETFEGYPTPRAFVLYELINANSFSAVPLDLPLSHGTSRIMRTGVGQFAVSVGYSDLNPIWLDQLHYMSQNTRIYFLDGMNTTYP